MRPITPIETSPSCTPGKIVRRGRRSNGCVRAKAGHRSDEVNTVTFSRIKFPKVTMMPKDVESTRRVNQERSTIEAIVDGSAFKYPRDVFHSSDNIYYYGESHGYEYPVKVEIFRHVRTQHLNRYTATEPIYFAAFVQTHATNESVCAPGVIPLGYRFFLAMYNPTAPSTCDWRDEINLHSAVFGPELLAEIFRMT